MSVLAVIPARGGSKGIPRKNVRPLAGKPLIAWTIEAALAATSTDRVVVSTDDEEIEVVARAHGADIVHRPAELATDEASSESALLHTLEYLAKEERYRPDVLAFLQCTSPLTTATDIDSTVALVLDGGYDSAVTMTRFHYFLWQERQQGEMTGINHEATRRLRRQEREAEYQEVGAVYAMQVAGLERTGFRFFGRIGKYLLPSLRAFEIDEPDDWPVAEALMMASGRTTQQNRPSRARLAQIKAVITDFDGVMTDNTVQVNQHGVESVVCNRSDGWGLDMLRDAGYLLACISTETNDVVKARCEKLGIPYWRGQRHKLTIFRQFLEEHGLAASATLYVGNDTNDAPCLEHAGIAVVPADAAPEAAALANWQTEAAGGEGVLREVARALLRAREEANDR